MTEDLLIDRALLAQVQLQIMSYSIGPNCGIEVHKVAHLVWRFEENYDISFGGFNMGKGKTSGHSHSPPEPVGFFTARTSFS